MTFSLSLNDFRRLAPFFGRIAGSDEKSRQERGKSGDKTRAIHIPQV
jgi:hypothetical protein